MYLPCSCGKLHKIDTEVIVEKNAISRLPEFLEKLQSEKVFILADKNTYNAAGEKVKNALKGYKISQYVYNYDVLPNEEAVGSAIMNFDVTSDVVIGIGSGVINDIGKILSSVTGKPYIIVATAPSMDGYASKTSSMEKDGLKASLNSKCADVIIGDIDVLKNAPLKMLKAGLGDMLAKYVSICEWRIANLILGEYYCENVASLVRSALKKCVDNAQKLLERDEDAVRAVFEGLILGGVAMAYVGVSRPASGVEHYFSHIWDMRGLEFNTPIELHGIQCGIGTYLAVKLYEQIKLIKPDKEKALSYAENFDKEVWNAQLKKLIGKGADAMIALEEKEQKYSLEKHRQRLDKIIENWEQIINIINEEIPAIEELEKILDDIEAPKTPEEIGLDEDMLLHFKATKDIRDKYVLSRLFWDLGIIDDAKI